MRSLAAAIVAIAQIGSASAERPDGDGEIAGAYGFSARMRIGTATAPFYAPGLEEARSEFTQARSFILAAHLAVGRWTVGGRLPAAPSTVRQPAGSYADEKSVGNPELFVEGQPRRFDLDGRVLSVSLRLAAGLPLADHGEPETLVKSRALAISDAIDGWLERELYVPGVVPITGSARLALDGDRWRLSGRVKLGAMIRVSRASLPDEARLRPLALVPSVVARAAWWPTPRIGAVAGGWLVISAPAPVELPAGRDQIVQPGLEARVIVRASRGAAVFVEGARPLGGPLAGTATLGIGASLAYP